MDVIRVILSYLKVREIPRLRFVSRDWNEAASDGFISECLKNQYGVVIEKSRDSLIENFKWFTCEHRTYSNGYYISIIDDGIITTSFESLNIFNGSGKSVTTIKQYNADYIKIYKNILIYKDPLSKWIVIKFNMREKKFQVIDKFPFNIDSNHEIRNDKDEPEICYKFQMSQYCIIDRNSYVCGNKIVKLINDYYSYSGFTINDLDRKSFEQINFNIRILKVLIFIHIIVVIYEEYIIIYSLETLKIVSKIGVSRYKNPLIWSNESPNNIDEPCCISDCNFNRDIIYVGCDDGSLKVVNFKTLKTSLLKKFNSKVIKVSQFSHGRLLCVVDTSVWIIDGF